MTRIALLVSSLVLAVSSTADAQTRYATNIESTPPGATVYLDSTSTAPLGITPMRSVRIARGVHNFIYRLEGYQETTVSLDVKRSRLTVNAALQQLSRVQISAGDESAQGANVVIDGEVVGTVPYSGYLRPDRVQIVISRDGFVSSDQWVTLTAGQVFAWPVTLRANAPRMGSLTIFSDSRGVPVFIDGTQRCTTPCVLGEIPEGPHLVEVRPADGSRPHTQQVAIVAGQASSVDAQLQVGGSVRVISRTPGAIVTVDGEIVGPAPATREGLSAGDHIVEVSAPNYESGRQTVSITAGQQRVISIDLTASAATTSTLRVIGTPRGATVSVDGTPVGDLPAEVANLPAGDHIVEVAMEGHVTSTQTVTLVAGQPRVVSIALNESERAPGRILIRANTAGATAIIDGGAPVSVPYALDRAPVGTHAIIVRAPGVAEYSTTCVVGPGQDCDVTAVLSTASVRFRIATQSGIDGAMLYIDNSEAGPVPFDGPVAAGVHRIEVRAPGYRTWEERVNLDETQPLVMEARLVSVDELTPEEIAEREIAREREMRGAFGSTAATLPADLANVEIRAGWPYLADVRFRMGLHPNVDVGLGVRNAGRLTEFAMMARGGYRVDRRFSVGGEFQLGGGFAPRRTVAGEEHKGSSFLTIVDARASFHATRVAAITFNIGLEFTSDRWDFEFGDRDIVIPNADRQNSARGRFGATLEFALGNHDSLLFSALAIVGTPRRVLGDMFGNENITYEDTNIGAHSQLQLGWVHKFNWRYDDDL